MNSAINGANKKLGLGYLLGFAGKRRWLLYLGCALSAVAMLLTFGPYICIWLVARDLIAVAPDWAAAENLALYGWLAFLSRSRISCFTSSRCSARTRARSAPRRTCEKRACLTS